MLALSGVFPPQNLKQVIFIHINKNLVKHEKEMWECLKACGVPALPCRIETYDVFANGYTNYEKLMPFTYKILVTHPRYEEKCWNYIIDNPTVFRPYLNDRTLFWIVGSEPKSYVQQDAFQEAELSLQA